MTSSAISGKGTLLVRDVASTPAKAYPIAELTNIGGPDSTCGEEDVTSHDTQGRYREYRPTLNDGGMFPIGGFFIPGDSNGQLALIADAAAGTPRTFWIHFPNVLHNSWTFTGIPKNIKLTPPVDGIIKFKADIRVSGADTMHTTGAAGLTTPFFALRDNGANAVTAAPTKAGTTYEYTATLDSGDTAVAVQPTAAAGTIYVNGSIVATGAWSSDIPVTAATTKLITIEVRESNKASKVYRIYVTRP